MKRIVCAILILTLSFVSMYNVKSDELTDAQKNLNNVQKSIDDKKGELEEINKEKKSVENSLKELNEKLRSTSESLTDLNDKIAALDSQVSELDKQVQESETSLQQQKELYDQRVRAIYINGSGGYLGILLGAANFSDLVDRLEFVKRILDYDKNLQNKMETQKKALEVQKNEAEARRNETASLREQAAGKLKEISMASDDKKNIMSELEKDKAAYERAIKEEEEQSKAIALMIKQIQKKKEEEKKKQSTIPNNVISGGSSSIGKLYCVTGKPAYVTSPYGWRIHPVLGTKKLHTGMDLGVGVGTPIYALADGEVIYSGWMSGYGNVIMLDHGNLVSLYAHNSSLVGKVGQKVKGGQLISYSGNTGLSTGPHLHFEIRKSNGETIDPSPYYVK